MRCALVSLVVLLSLAPCAMAQDAPPDADLGLPPVDADALMADVTRLAGELRAEAERLTATEGKEGAIARLRAEAKADEAVAFQRMNLAAVVAVLAGDAKGASDIVRGDITACADEELPLALARHAVLMGPADLGCRRASYTDLAWQGHRAATSAARLARLATILAGLERIAPDSLDCATSYNNTGIVYRERGALDRALEYYRKGLAIRERIAPDSLDCAASYGSIGNAYSDRGDRDGALEYYQKALALQERLAPDSRGCAASYYNIALIYAARGDLERALEYSLKDIAVTERIAPDSLDCATSYNNTGIVYYERGDLDRALEYYEKGLTIRERLAPGSLDCATSYGSIGNVHSDRGDPDRALECYGKGLAIQERLAPGSLGCATSYNNIGAIYYFCGDLGRALDYWQKGLSIKERLAPDSLDCATSYNNIGQVWYSRGDLEQALGYARRGMEIRERLAPDSLWCATSYACLANVDSARGDLVRALERFRTALAIRERLAPDSLAHAASYGDMGNAYRSRGDSATALEYYLKGLGITERIAPNSRACATSHVNLGNACADRGDPDRALEHYERGLAILERLAPESLDCAACYNDIGLIHRDRGDFDRALEDYGKSLAIREVLAPGSLGCAMCYNNVGAIHRARGDTARALEHFEECCVIGRTQAPGSALHAKWTANAASMVARQGRTAEVGPLYEEAVTALESARARSASAGEEEARRGFSGQYEWIYRDYIRFLLDQGDAEGAAGISERMRAQGLREALFARVVSAAGSAGAEISAEWERIGGMREALPARIEAARARKDDALVAEIEAERGQLDQDEAALRDRARTESPRLAAILFPEKLGIEALQALLGPEDVALSYVLGKDGVNVLVLTSAGPVEAVKLPVTADEVRAALFAADAPEGADYRWVTRIAEAPGEEGADDRGIPLEARGIPIEARGEGDGSRGGSGLYLQPEAMAEACRTLWGNLLAPVADKLGDRKRVLVLPDGVLYTVPWAALTDGDGEALLERAAVVVLPSLQTLGLLRTEAGARAAVRTDRQELCAVGGAEYPDAPGEYGGLRDAVADYSPRETILAKVRAKEPVGLGPLPFAGMEVLAVGQTLGAYPGILAGPDATEPLARERAPHSRYVHFACHGYFDYRNPLDSGLILGLTQANPDDPTADGFLTAEDILGLAFSGKGLDADLVTLSACRTAVGKDSGGEGMIGLTRALMFAGTPTVVSTLWSVADESTKELMARFYTNVKAGLDKAAALRQAQLSLRGDARWSSPYYWAPFVLWGDWN